MALLLDANRYCGTLVVHKITREQVEAMAKAATSLVKPDMVEVMVSGFLRNLPGDMVLSPADLDELEERAVKAIVKGLTKRLMMEELKNHGFDVSQDVNSWQTKDELGEWVSTTFTQGDDAIPVQ